MAPNAYSESKRQQFFLAYDQRQPREHLSSVASSSGISMSTASRWLRARDNAIESDTLRDQYLNDIDHRQPNEANEVIRGRHHISDRLGKQWEKLERTRDWEKEREPAEGTEKGNTPATRGTKRKPPSTDENSDSDQATMPALGGRRKKVQKVEQPSSPRTRKPSSGEETSDSRRIRLSFLGGMHGRVRLKRQPVKKQVSSSGDDETSSPSDSQ